MNAEAWIATWFATLFFVLCCWCSWKAAQSNVDADYALAWGTGISAVILAGVAIHCAV